MLLSALLLCTSCQKADVWTWSVEENAYDGIVFPGKALLSLNSSSESQLEAILSVEYKEAVSSGREGDLDIAQIWFDLKDIPVRVTRSGVYLKAGEFPGTIRYFKRYYGLCVSSLTVLSGKYSFTARLNREESHYSWDNKLADGDRLSGEWTIHFESDEGERLLFKLTDIQVNTLLPTI